MPEAAAGEAGDIPKVLAILPGSGACTTKCSGIWRHAPLPTNPHVFVKEKPKLDDVPEWLKGVMLEDWKKDGTILYWCETYWRTSTDTKSADPENTDGYGFGAGLQSGKCPYGPEEKYRKQGYENSLGVFVWNPNDMAMRLATSLAEGDMGQVSRLLTGQSEPEAYPDCVMIAPLDFESRQRHPMLGCYLRMPHKDNPDCFVERHLPQERYPGESPEPVELAEQRFFWCRGENKWCATHVAKTASPCTTSGASCNELVESPHLFYVCKATLESVKEKLQKDEEISAAIVNELAFPKDLPDEEIMVPVVMRDVAHEFDDAVVLRDAEHMIEKLGFKGTAEAFVKAAEYLDEEGRCRPRQWRQVLSLHDNITEQTKYTTTTFPNQNVQLIWNPPERIVVAFIEATSSRYNDGSFFDMLARFC